MIEREGHVNIVEGNDVILARQKGRKIAQEVGFRAIEQTRLATAISELTRNVLVHAVRGECFIKGWQENQTSHLEVVVEDHGPGISDISQALEDGFSTAGGLGAGLPGTRRLMDSFHIFSEPGHTRISIGMQRKMR
ncbi:MAG: ATP-binding protein [Magnetococcales bacterium]|nr:ATP-binding protein [Magnetococcales bacterium]